MELTAKAWAVGFWQENQEVCQVSGAVAEAKKSRNALHSKAGEAVRYVLGLLLAAGPTLRCASACQDNHL